MKNAFLDTPSFSSSDTSTQTTTVTSCLPDPEPLALPPPKVALVLGSGGARGIAHLGVLQALQELHVAPCIAVGTSIGALIAATYATGTSELFRSTLLSMSLRDIARLFIEPGIPRNGLIEGKRVMDKIAQCIPDVEIGHLRIAYAAVAFDIISQVESIHASGSILQAIRASISIPGIFTPVHHNHQWLVDGGLSNPLPVNVARSLGAQRTLAVDINLLPGSPSHASDSSILSRILHASPSTPSLVEVLLQSIRVAENSIQRDQLQKSPPDILLSLPVGHIPTLDFRNPADLIQIGYEHTLQMAPKIQELFQT